MIYKSNISFYDLYSRFKNNDRHKDYIDKLKVGDKIKYYDCLTVDDGVIAEKYPRGHGRSMFKVLYDHHYLTIGWEQIIPPFELANASIMETE